MLVVRSGERLSSYSKYDRGRNLVVDANFNKKYGLKFENTEALNAVRDILAHVCTVCEKELEFRTFDDLSQHMRRAHELFYCDLCATNLQLFSWERKCYSREQLAKHRRMGDPDDRSHRGHPLCEFCDERYMDDEQLYRHLRKDHYFCHYCDADGLNKFYAATEELKKHMKSDHFLCEDGQCKHEPLGIAFRHEIDFKAHKASVHGAKQERIVNVNFDVRRGDANGGERERSYRDHRGDRSNRDRDHGQQQHQGQRGNGGGQNRGAGSKLTTGTKPDQQPPRRDKPTSRKGENDESDDPELLRTLEASKAALNPFALKKEEFPSLNPVTNQSSAAASKTKTNPNSLANLVAYNAGKTVRSGSLDENDFPSLPPSAKNAKKQAKKKASEEIDGARARRNSRSVSPVKNLSQKATNFVMVDDDESFPSASVVLKEQEEAAKTAAKAKVEEEKKKAKENEQMKQLKMTPQWGVRPGSSSTSKQQKSSAWDTKDEAFPALATRSGGGGGSPNKPQKETKKNNTDLASKPWSQLLLLDDKAEIPKKKEKESSKKKKQNSSPSSMPTDALMEALPGLPIKSKARRVAQQKQRPSECSEEGFGNEAMKNTMVTTPSASISLEPPPGFENSTAKSVPPPPGFESNSTPSSKLTQNGSMGEYNKPNSPQTSVDKPTNKQQYQYKKPQNFDLRNRGLFDRLSASMGNDDTRIQQFKKASSEFRRGESDAATYSERVRELLNDDGAYVRIFTELVCLLPDIERQNALWNAFRSATTTLGSGFGPSGSDIVKRCSKCGQLLGKIDYYEHAQLAHPMKGMGKGKVDFEEDYPALG